MSKECDLAESPITNAEGQQIRNSLDGSIDTAIASKPSADDENEDDISTDCAVEGVGGLEGDALRYMNAFYVLLKDWFRQKNYTSVLLTREGYNKRHEFELYLNNGGDSRESQLNGNSNALLTMMKKLTMFHQDATLFARKKMQTCRRRHILSLKKS